MSNPKTINQYQSNKPIFKTNVCDIYVNFGNINFKNYNKAWNSVCCCRRRWSFSLAQKIRCYSKEERAKKIGRIDNFVFLILFGRQKSTMLLISSPMPPLLTVGIRFFPFNYSTRTNCTVLHEKGYARQAASSLNRLIRLRICVSLFVWH